MAFRQHEGVAGRSLHAAYWTFVQSVSLLIDEFHPEGRSEFDERDAQANQAFRNANHWEATGRLETAPENAEMSMPDPPADGE